MRVLTFVAAFLLIQANGLAALRQVRFSNPTESRYDLYFKPEQAQKFLTPPLQLPPKQNAKLQLTAQGKYWTVLRSWSIDNKYVDHTIGWIDLHRVSLDYPQAELQFEPYTRPEQKLRTVTITRHVERQQTRADGTTYTIQVPVHAVKQETYTVDVTAIRATLMLPREAARTNRKVDAQPYIIGKPE